MASIFCYPKARTCLLPYDKTQIFLTKNITFLQPLQGQGILYDHGLDTTFSQSLTLTFHKQEHGYFFDTLVPGGWPVYEVSSNNIITINQGHSHLGRKCFCKLEPLLWPDFFPVTRDATI